MRQIAKRIFVGTPLEPFARRLAGLLNRVGLLQDPMPAEDEWLVDVLRRSLRPDSNCIDVGCSGGAILRQMITFAPEGRHAAFEPLPHRAEELRQLFPAVKIFEMALSDTSGEAEFNHVLENTGYSGLRERKYPSEKMSVEKIRVQVDRLDHVLPQNRKFDFLKIDVEGAELQVLMGAEETLSKHRPLVAFEHGPGASEYYGTSPRMVFEYLSNQGYEIYLFPDWLAGGSSLSMDEFAKQYGGKHWNFLAAPISTDKAT